MKIESLLTNPTNCDTIDPSTKVGNSSRITKITPGVKNKNRLNIFVNDKFFCSLDISQLTDLKLKTGQILSQQELDQLKTASNFGKLYTRALEYILIRPRSQKEVQDYLKRKTLNRPIRTKNPKTREYQTKIQPGFDKSLIEPVLAQLSSKGYLNDQKFATAWAQNRNQSKGISQKKLIIELKRKGIATSIINQVLENTDRNDKTEIKKNIAKKRQRYDNQKLAQYLLRQGFNYQDIQEALSEEDSASFEA